MKRVPSSYYFCEMNLIIIQFVFYQFPIFFKLTSSKRWRFQLLHRHQSRTITDNHGQSRIH